MRSNLRSLPALLCVALLSAACASGRESVAAFDHSRPSEVPPPFTSRVHLPIRIPMEALRSRAETLLPEELARIEDTPVATASTVSVRLVRDGPLGLETADGAILWSVPVRLEKGRVDFRVQRTLNLGFGLQKEVSAGHHVDFGGAFILRGRTTVALSPDWSLVSRTSATPEWTESLTVRIDLKVGSFTVDVARLASDAVGRHIGEAAGEIDRRLRAVARARERAEAAWEALRKPVRVFGDPALWISVRALRCFLPPPESRGDAILLSPAVYAEFRATLGAAPEPADPGPLPDLDTVPTSGSGFQLSAPVDIPFRDLQPLLRERVVGREFKMPSGDTIRVRDLAVSGDGERLGVYADVSMSEGRLLGFEGRLHLSCRPRIDEEAEYLYVEDLAYELETANVLASMADWISHDSFVADLEERMRVPIGARTETIRRRVNRQLADFRPGQGIVLRGAVDHVRPLAPVMREDGLEIWVELGGTVEAELER